MTYLQVLAIAGQIFGALSQLVAGQPVTFRTYIGKTHVEVSMTVLP